jgi:hypothetical protein
MTDEDALETLRDQIRAATEAAERLVREVGTARETAGSGRERRSRPASGPAAVQNAGPGERRASRSDAGERGTPSGSGADDARGAARPTGARIPPAGWEAGAQSETAAELEALAKLLQTLRDLLPEDLQRQLTEVIRQLLILLRTLIDWIVARIEREGRGQEIEVEDIPIN